MECRGVGRGAWKHGASEYGSRMQRTSGGSRAERPRQRAGGKARQCKGSLHEDGLLSAQRRGKLMDLGSPETRCRPNARERERDEESGVELPSRTHEKWSDLKLEVLFQLLIHQPSPPGSSAPSPAVAAPSSRRPKASRAT